MTDECRTLKIPPPTRNWVTNPDDPYAAWLDGHLVMIEGESAVVVVAGAPALIFHCKSLVEACGVAELEILEWS